MPLEILAHLAAVGLLYLQFEPLHNNPDFQWVIYALAGLCGVRLLILLSVKLYDHYRIDGAGIGGTFMLYANNLMAGCVWSGALLWLSHFSSVVSFNETYHTHEKC